MMADTQETRPRDIPRTAVELIAEATGAPLEMVREAYDREIQTLRAAAKIEQFVSVIATRRVWLQLRAH